MMLFRAKESSLVWPPLKNELKTMIKEDIWPLQTIGEIIKNGGKDMRNGVSRKYTCLLKKFQNFFRIFLLPVGMQIDCLFSKIILWIFLKAKFLLLVWLFLLLNLLPLEVGNHHSYLTLFTVARNSSAEEYTNHSRSSSTMNNMNNELLEYF